MHWQDAALALAGLIGSGTAVVHGVLVQKLMVRPIAASLGPERKIAAPIRRLVPVLLHFSTFAWFPGGLALIAWRYSESGDFVDFQRQNAIFPGRFVASGTEPGPVLLGGIRFAGDSVSGGFEVRYLSGDAGLDRPFSILLTNPRIDLGGWTYAGTIGWRFGR